MTARSRSIRTANRGHRHHARSRLEVVDTGDFSGDGLDDFLRVNDEGYVVGEMSNGNGTFSPQVLNLKNAGWDIPGTGDFDGNGSHDIAMINDVGVVGIWGVTDGYLSSWSILRAVTQE